jgi:methenyltetrahydromethanopterin cyclohydrolase
MTSLNEQTWQYIQQILPDLEKEKCKVIPMACKTLVVDCGCEVPGSHQAGIFLAKCCMANLGTAELSSEKKVEKDWLIVRVVSKSPLTGCFLSQAAVWPVKVGDFQAMGSGPACLLLPEHPFLEEYLLNEEATHAVVLLETRQLPDEQVCCAIAQKCRVQPENLAILVAPTASLAGTVQIAARSVETALHKMHQMGIDLNIVEAAQGYCPVAPAGMDDLLALGSTNDAILLASSVHLVVYSGEHPDLAQWTQKIPSCSSPLYGKPFLSALKEAGGFYNLDPNYFAPAEISIEVLSSMRLYRAGSVDFSALKSALNI